MKSVTAPRAGGCMGILWDAHFRPTTHLLLVDLRHCQEFSTGIQNQHVAENPGEESLQKFLLVKLLCAF